MIKSGLIPLVGADKRLNELAAEGYIPVTSTHVPDPSGATLGSVWICVAKFDAAPTPAGAAAEPAAEPTSAPATVSVSTEPPPALPPAPPAAPAPKKPRPSRKRPSKNGHKKSAGPLPEPTVIPAEARQ